MFVFVIFLWNLHITFPISKSQKPILESFFIVIVPHFLQLTFSCLFSTKSKPLLPFKFCFFQTTFSRILSLFTKPNLPFKFCFFQTTFSHFFSTNSKPLLPFKFCFFQTTFSRFL